MPALNCDYKKRLLISYLIDKNKLEVMYCQSKDSKRKKSYQKMQLEK